MKLHIDKYKEHEYGDYIDEDGCHWDTEVSFLQGKILDFCCCGLPEDNLKYILRILEHIDTKIYFSDKKEDGKISYDKWRGKGKEIGSEESLYFAYYVLDKLGLTEHGSSVPGWVTDKGKEFMDDVRELIKHGVIE